MTSCFFFFNDTATTEIYTLSLHDALPIYFSQHRGSLTPCGSGECFAVGLGEGPERCRHCRGNRQNQKPRNWRGTRPVDGDRKSTRLNSSHGYISYAVFCLKKKTIPHTTSP